MFLKREKKYNDEQKALDERYNKNMFWFVLSKICEQN